MDQPLVHIQSTAYDFLLNKASQPAITEISYTYLDKAVANCPGHWDDQLKWHPGQIWPEQAQVDDFLENIKKQSIIHQTGLVHGGTAH